MATTSKQTNKQKPADNYYCTGPGTDSEHSSSVLSFRNATSFSGNKLIKGGPRWSGKMSCGLSGRYLSKCLFMLVIGLVIALHKTLNEITLGYISAPATNDIYTYWSATCGRRGNILHLLQQHEAVVIVWLNWPIVVQSYQPVRLGNQLQT